MSRTTYAIYIRQSGLANLRIGLASRVWGWRQSTFDRSEGASVIRSMKVDDLVLLVRGGPNPRVARYGWTGARMAGIDVCKVVHGSQRSTSPVWPDDVYPERIGIELVDSIPPGVDLGQETLEALRMSAKQAGGARRGELHLSLIGGAIGRTRRGINSLPSGLS
jgi:hypothetical protein